MDATTKAQALVRLRRIAGQVGGIQRMLEDDRYCVDVLLQIAAAEAGLSETAKIILAGHIGACLNDAFKTGTEDEQRRKLREIVDVFARFCRLDVERPPEVGRGGEPP